MIQIHYQFRSEAEALEASRELHRDIRRASGYRYPPTLELLTADRVSRFIGGLLMNERVHGYAERPHRIESAVADGTCPCAVCTWRRANRVGGAT